MMGPCDDRPSDAERRAPVARGATIPTTTAVAPGGDAPMSRFFAVIQIANFAILRRHMGVVRAGVLGYEIAARIEQVCPDLLPMVVGRDRLEISVPAMTRPAFDRAVTLIDRTFEAVFDVDGEQFAVELLVGAAAAPLTHRDEVLLIDEAERAIEAARESRQPVVRDVGDLPLPSEHQDLMRDLQAAIGRGELFLQYQPKVHVRRQQIDSVEALVRWQHPTRGLIPPGDFIGLAEQTHHIVDLTIWTIQQAVRDYRVLVERGHDLTIFVNISAILLSDARFVRRACSLVEGSGARLGFEITETGVIRDPDSAIAHLRAFADIGVVIAIDDYGAGLSSLAYLKKLPARELKIDKLFVTQLTSSNRDPLIVRSTIDLAHALEMEVVAEGVETPSALALLSVMGCDVVQGFLISRPLGLAALMDFLDADLSCGLKQKVTALPSFAAFRRG